MLQELLIESGFLDGKQSTFVMKIQTATLAASIRSGFSFEYGDGDGMRRFEDKMSKSASYRTSADDGYVEGHLDF